MERGKHICSQLKAVRRSIAEENGIPLEIKECTYHGPCRGTCPRCEAEVRYLENALANKLRIGRVATIAGLSLGLAACGGQLVEGEVPNELTDTPSPAPDTVQQVADTARPLWREPNLDSLLDINVGDIEVIDPDDTLPDSDVDIEEGEVSIQPFAEVDPEFPGGLEALYKFITDNLNYPQLALENAIQGKVYVTFVVETDGSVSNVRILRDIGGGCGLEAKRVVKMMPKWKPGKQGGKVVRTQYNLPINFVLPEDRPRVIEGMAPVEYGTRMPADSAQHELIGPNAPAQQMEVEGVKLIVR